MLWGLFGGKRDRQARINDDPSPLTVQAGQDLLSAALEAGFAWPHDCRQGNCSTCRCRITSGKIKARTDFETVLTPAELKEGWVLACQSELRSDIEVEVELTSEEPQAAVAHYGGTVTRMVALTHDIVELTVQVPDLQRAGVAGQYAELGYDGLSVPRSYSFAKAPSNEQEEEISFYIRKVPGGEFTEWLFAEDRTGTELKVSLPYGGFRYHPESGPMICIAGGSGMSAIRAVLEQAVLDQVERDALFLFGARTQQDLYGEEAMGAIRRQWHPDYKFEYVEVLNMEPEDSDWAGPRGLVTDYLKEAYVEPKTFDMAACQGYLCGPPPMIDAAVEVLKAEGMSGDQIFFDKFLDASSMPGGRPGT
ncbi:MAG: 2Fe-2S iron-sulfur cluster binding domain-containing protein [Gammaproteobacteria bacterium]|nr:2Fe-2S iron-sulfur cluster binding domain-containing protein [Gammaproteobacteria bacterium]